MSTTSRIPATFMSVSQFKNATSSSKLEVVFNKKSGKLTLLADESDFYKCQQDIDQHLPMAFILPNHVVMADGSQRPSTIDDACLINVNNESPLETRFTL